LPVFSIAAYLGREGWCIGCELRSGCRRSVQTTSDDNPSNYENRCGLAKPALTTMVSSADGRENNFRLMSWRKP